MIIPQINGILQYIYQHTNIVQERHIQHAITLNIVPKFYKFDL